MSLVNIFEYETLAQKRMEPSAWAFYQSGSEGEVTLRENRAAFERIRLRPRMLVDVEHCDMSTTTLGTPVSMPILVAPTADHCLAHPEGECATAQAVGRVETLMVASSSATRSLEDVAQAATGPLWFQLYVYDRQATEDMVQRVARAGYRALVVTVDTPRFGRKDSALKAGYTQLPPHLSRANFINYELTKVYASLTWSDLAWLRSLSPLPILLKGILTAEDALLALEHGVDGIIVSNHGGRQLDSAIPSIEALPEIVDAVAGRCEVYLDGGIRRGTDVLKALALGAHAVLVGRPILWGLAARGPEGVYEVLELLRDELALAMRLAGCAKLQDIGRALVKLP
jgi:isopentenyl diphosphate isomerase/L-lactate dehydrogenase-like FMN-dependent dehydrogenase